MAAGSAYLWNEPPAKLGFAFSVVLLTYFVIVFVIDMEHRLILHLTSIAGAVLGLAAGWLSRGIVPTLLGGLGG